MFCRNRHANDQSPLSRSTMNSDDEPNTRGNGGTGDNHSKGLGNAGRHRVLQTLLVLSMTLLQQQKATSAIASAAAASTEYPTSTTKSPTPNTASSKSLHNGQAEIGRDISDGEYNDEDGIFITSHEDADEDENLILVEDEDGNHQAEEDEGRPAPTDVLIVSTADGSLMGLSKLTGELIWTQNGQHVNTEDPTENDFKAQTNTEKHTVFEASSLSLLEPLVATSTTAQSFASRDWRTAAVPSLDGKTVYLTANVPHAQRRRNDNASPEITVTTSIPELVDRAPFVDNRGRIYNGSRSSVAVAVDGNTGEILKVISTQGKISSSGLFESGIDEDVDVEWDVGIGEERDDNKKPRRNVVWMGRVDHSISIHEPRSGNLDVRFSAAEIKSVRDMILGQTTPEDQPPWEAASPDPAAGMFLSSTDSSAGKETSSYPDSTSLWKAVTATPSAINTETCLVATPRGDLAYRNPRTGQIDWVSPVRFDAPVAFAFDADSGATLPIDIVPDAPLASNDSSDYLTREINRQYNNLLADSSASNVGTTKPDPLVGSFAENGQLFAIPLGDNLRLRRRRHALLSAAATGTASSLHSKPNGGHRDPLLSTALSVHGRNHANFEKNAQNSFERTCIAGMNDFPACFISSSLSFQDDTAAHFLDPGTKKPSTTGLVPFTGHLSSHDSYNDIFGGPGHQARPPPQKHYQRIARILGSWLPPTLALIFVVSFELGRRKRQKDLKQVDESSIVQSDTSSNGCVIQVNQNVILGYGGHGTVVYEGTLEGRNVAVKRMLRTYHASADREISLLIESDGHPNVVRYFLKEVRGDFVYLALELCDLSLHELIGHMSAAYDLMEKENWFEKDNMAIPNAVRSVLLQIANGVKHLHRLRIVHRDLKPANILLADSRKSRRKGDLQESIFEIFSQGDYVAKISDMGLGKQIVGQSSYGGSAAGESLRGQSVSNGEAPSIVGAGPGSVGWQAPEVMVLRTQSSDMSTRSEGSGSGFDFNSDTVSSPIDAVARTSRSVDIFSLGCIFYSTLVPGSHPFGEWYEREANIMHNKPDLSALRNISVEAYDLVSSMVARNPSLRPTAAQVCDHPYFWSSERRLLFLCGFSDRLEQEGLGNSLDESCAPSSSYSRMIMVERNAVDVVGTSWDTALDDDLVNNVQRFRTYDPSSVRDLLRLIRNKYHHFEELPDRLKTLMGSKTDGLSIYFEQCFPALLIHCFKVCSAILSADDPLAIKYSIPKHKVLDLRTSPIPEGLPASELSATAPYQEKREVPFEAVGDDDFPNEKKESVPVKHDHSTKVDAVPELISSPPVADCDEYSGLADRDHASAADAGDVIVWESSTAAKTFNNRGWYRSDDDWVRRTDASLRKPNSNLVRCMDDAKYRTRLCNHWDSSLGTFCPMRKKGKCVFAHGPVELRVKETKRNRWGKLVDKNGDNKNPNHSGGEDTYGAARSIETERKQEGKWNVDKASNKGKKIPYHKKKESNPQ